MLFDFSVYGLIQSQSIVSAINWCNISTVIGRLSRRLMRFLHRNTPNVFGCIYLRQATEGSFSFLRSLLAEPGAWVGNVLLPKTQMCIWSRKVWIRYLDCLRWKWKSLGRCKGGVLGNPVDPAMAQLASQQTAKTKVEVGIARRSQVLPCNPSSTRPHGLSNGPSELVPAGGTLPCRARLSSKHACRPPSRPNST
jgi:hypothetical protein